MNSDNKKRAAAGASGAAGKGGNPLGNAPVNSLMFKFAIPSIIAMLVGSIYNIVDQLFIGHAVGPLGNAATNIAFPLAILCTATALLFGIGGASNFNLCMGREQTEEAPFYIGNVVTSVLGIGTLLTVIAELFLPQLLQAFGSPADVLPFAMTYVRITAIGFPFLILTTAGGHIIRADGSPKMAMFCNLSGAIINTFLDALFVLVFKWGMAGAAYATVIGQVFSGFLVLNYLRGYKTVKLNKVHFVPNLHYIGGIARIGMGSGINQLAMMVVQITLNNSLKFYGAASQYGESIPIACAGIVTKVNQMFFSVVIGLAQGSQPIESFNYGAKNYKRVKEAYRYALTTAFVISIVSFVLFQTIPRQLISLFGSGSEEYFQFAIMYFRIYLFFTWANCVQPVTATFFTSIGKASKGVFLSLTRQVLFLLPLVLILPRFFGIDGILYAGPIADFVAAVCALWMARNEFRIMDKMAKEIG